MGISLTSSPGITTYSHQAPNLYSKTPEGKQEIKSKLEQLIPEDNDTKLERKAAKAVSPSVASEVKKEGGIAIVGAGPSGLASALVAASHNCPVTIYAPKTPLETPRKEPLLNFRQDHVDFMVKLGVSEEIFGNVDGATVIKQVPDGNRYKTPATKQVWYQDLISELYKASQSKPELITFKEALSSADELPEIGSDHGMLLLATGANKISKDFMSETGYESVKPYSDHSVQIYESHTRFISGVLQVPEEAMPETIGKALIHRDSEHGGISVALRQNRAGHENDVWINVQVPNHVATDVDATKLLVNKVKMLYGDKTVIENTPRPFEVTSRVVTDDLPKKMTDSNGRSVYVFPVGDIAGSGGFRSGAGAGTGIEHAMELDYRLSRPSAEGYSTKGVPDRSAAKLWQGIKLAVKDRIQAESALVRFDEDALTTKQMEQLYSQYEPTIVKPSQVDTTPVKPGLKSTDEVAKKAIPGGEAAKDLLAIY